MSNLVKFVAAILALTFTVRGQDWVSIDILTAADGETPPDGSVVLDLMAEVLETDAWTATGMRLFARNGAQIVYAHDPNTAAAMLINPGLENRFVTCLSRPRPRQGNGRFGNAGADVVGEYCPAGPNPPTATATELNVAWYSVPPPNPASPSEDGAIARVVITPPPGGFCQGADCCDAGVYPIDEVPGSYVIYLESRCLFGDDPGTVYATFDNPALRGSSWVFAVNPYLRCFFDVDQDQTEIGVGDLAALLAAFGSCPGDTNYNGLAANLDHQPCVTIGDLAVLLAHFGELCCLY